MATNKNQHFVPRCYLKAFTVDGKNAAINIYNTERKLFIKNAPVKNQCSRDYFYGTDLLLENAIQSIEGNYGVVFNEISRPGYRLSESHQISLKRFWLFQHMRTEAAAIKSVELSESIREYAELSGAEYKIEIKEAVRIAMRHFAEEMHIVDDLKLCILKNKTKIPFITCDDPAVLTNKWWLSDKRTKGRSFGLGSSGIMTILPLSPKLFALGYDGDVYNVPHEHGMVNITKENDVIALNQHLILHSRANLFIQDLSSENIIRANVDEVISNKPEQLHNFYYAIPDQKTREYTRYRVVSKEEAKLHEGALIHSQLIHPTPKKWPSIITIRSKGRIFTNGSSVGYVRSEIANGKPELDFMVERP